MGALLGLGMFWFALGNSPKAAVVEHTVAQTTYRTLVEGPRHVLYRLSGKGIFEGGKAYRGDLEARESRLKEKGPPYRPALNLPGIPLERARRIRSAGLSETAIDNEKGFTLIELVMVMLLLSILAAVAIPNFQDMRADARNSAVKGALGGVRSAVAIARATIALKEDVAAPVYPTVLEMQQNIYLGSHPVLSAVATTSTKRIVDASSGMPANPWSMTTIPIAQQASVIDCSALAKGNVRSAAGITDFGWCYNQTSGEFWANSSRNAGTAGNRENNF